MTVVERAEGEEGPALHRLRRDRETWLAGRGIDQWAPGSRSLGWLERSAARDEWYVVRTRGRVDAAVRLAWRDPEVWGERDEDAVHVHDLMVATTAAGQGLGRLLLRTAEERALERGLHLARLDCLEQNTALIGYYERAGYTVVGRPPSPYPHPGGWEWGALMEERLS